MWVDDPNTYDAVLKKVTAQSGEGVINPKIKTDQFQTHF